MNEIIAAVLIAGALAFWWGWRAGRTVEKRAHREFLLRLASAGRIADSWQSAP
jgi:hypothetical protein